VSEEESGIGAGGGEDEAPKCEGLTYAAAGVDVEAGRRAVDLFKEEARSTCGPEVLEGIGGFAALYDAALRGYRHPVLVSSVDGVGTKVKLAQMMDVHDTVGIDLVAMLVDDIVCCGARPLFLLDYLCMGRLVPERAASIVGGIARGCRRAGCALVGGETAEHPGLLGPDEYDLAGCVVGVVEKDRVIDGSSIRPSDALVGLASNGLHSNGYSLARKVFFEINQFNLDDHLRGLGRSLGEELLTPTEIYAPGILKALEKVEIKGIAHITGGGIIENLPRILPRGVDVVVDITAWPGRSIFQVIQSMGNIDQVEMFKTFNMGIGMVLVVDRQDLRQTMEIFANNAYRPYFIGEILEGSGGIKLTC
jgi:phosphoribosylformylglycinamidine cyclo-ligase